VARIGYDGSDHGVTNAMLNTKSVIRGAPARLPDSLKCLPDPWRRKQLQRQRLPSQSWPLQTQVLMGLRCFTWECFDAEAKRRRFARDRLRDDVGLVESSGKPPHSKRFWSRPFRLRHGLRRDLPTLPEAGRMGHPEI